MLYYLDLNLLFFFLLVDLNLLIAALHMLISYFAGGWGGGGDSNHRFLLKMCLSSLAIITFASVCLVNNVFIPQFCSRISWLAVGAE
jgi:hypothetical protein